MAYQYIAFIFSILLFCFSAASAGLSSDLPDLIVSGFTWAENLCFDGLGNLFVTDAVRGELTRIYLCNDGTEYCKDIHLDQGLRDLGGIQITPDGSTIYIGATLSNGSHAILSTSSAYNGGSFEILSLTKNKANGMAADWEHSVLYCTDEGTGSDEGGTVTAYDLVTRTESVIKDHVDRADGAWMDSTNRLLYIGELVTMKVMTFSTNSSSGLAEFVGEYAGLSFLGSPNMLDDITLDNPAAQFCGQREPSDKDTISSSVDSGGAVATVMYGADWTGRAVMRFALDGSSEDATVVPPPVGVELFEPTSVRWGKGPGFDPCSLYVTEGGGILPTQTNRRVLQVKIQ